MKITYVNADNWWYSPLKLDMKEASQECVFCLVVFFAFCTTVKAVGLQVRSMHGAVPQCAAHDAVNLTHTHTHTQPPHVMSAINNHRHY